MTSFRRRSRPVLCALLLSLCGAGMGSGAPSGQPQAGSGWTAPDGWVSRPNPVRGQAALAGGAKLFDDRCAQCHAADASGSDRAPDLTSTRVQRQTDGALYWKISTGNAFGGMPTFSYLPEGERWQLVLFLRTRARSAGALIR